MPIIHFEAKLYNIGSWTILNLPREASAKLPSRGQVMVKGTINDLAFQAALEPDGNGSHWLHVDKVLQKSAKVTSGDNARLAIKSTKDWPEPVVPPDLEATLKAHPEMRERWMDITPMARWEWIRWIAATLQPETRKRRIEATFSKLMTGERRPCCFNRAMCCVPEVSKSGVLLKPARQE